MREEQPVGLVHPKGLYIGVPKGQPGKGEYTGVACQPSGKCAFAEGSDRPIIWQGGRTDCTDYAGHWLYGVGVALGRRST